MKKMGMVKAWMAGMCIGAFVGGIVGAAMDEMCSCGTSNMVSALSRKFKKMI